MALTPKQELFAREYLLDFNATQAAIRAGYSAKTAYSQGHDLLKKPQIQALMSLARIERRQTYDATAENVIEGFRRIAFLDTRKVARWGQREMVEEVTDGKRKTKRKMMVPFMDLVSSEDLGDEEAMALSGVKMSAGSVELKMTDRLGALGQLARHLGLFEKDRADTNVHVTFQIDGAGSPAYEAG